MGAHICAAHTALMDGYFDFIPAHFQGQPFFQSHEAGRNGLCARPENVDKLFSFNHMKKLLGPLGL
jgi:hypothetical protein